MATKNVLTEPLLDCVSQTSHTGQLVRLEQSWTPRMPWNQLLHTDSQEQVILNLCTTTYTIYHDCSLSHTKALKV